MSNKPRLVCESDIAVRCAARLEPRQSVAVEQSVTQRQRSNITLRPHRVGDIGWVIHRHGVIYSQQYGWDFTFEALIARVAADFIDQFDGARDCCWIAEHDDTILGAAFVVKTDQEDTAKLRLVYVEPTAQGQGIGRQLVERCMMFARDAGYVRMALWTNDVLLPARALYRKLGFTMTDAKPYHGFGRELVGETWERTL